MLAWLAVAGILVLFTLALTWIAVIAGLSAKSVDGAAAFSYPIIFLPLISSAFVLTESMPGPVRAFAEHQPVTSIVDTIRDLFAQQPVSTDIWVALAWCLGILVVAYAVAMATYRRKIAEDRPRLRVVRVLRVRGEDPLVDVVDELGLVVVVVHDPGEPAPGELGLESSVGVPVLGVRAQPVTEQDQRCGSVAPGPKTCRLTDRSGLVSIRCSSQSGSRTRSTSPQRLERRHVRRLVGRVGDRQDHVDHRLRGQPGHRGRAHVLELQDDGHRAPAAPAGRALSTRAGPARVVRHDLAPRLPGRAGRPSTSDCRGR